MNPGEVWCEKKLREGHIRLTSENEVQVYHKQHQRWITKIPEQRKGRWKYKVGPGRHSVYKNRLVWMLTQKQSVPVGCCVDHINGDKRDDRPENLQLHSQVESDRQGSTVQVDKNFLQICQWFEAKLDKQDGEQR